MNNFGKILVVGSSGGIGAAIAEHLFPRTQELIGVSRSPSQFGRWIEADISNLAGIETVAASVGSTLDAILYMAGTWETKAFTSGYSFEQCSHEDLENVIAVQYFSVKLKMF